MKNVGFSFTQHSLISEHVRSYDFFSGIFPKSLCKKWVFFFFFRCCFLVFFFFFLNIFFDSMLKMISRIKATFFLWEIKSKWQRGRGIARYVKYLRYRNTDRDLLNSPAVLKWRRRYFTSRDARYRAFSFCPVISRVMRMSGNDIWTGD